MISMYSIYSDECRSWRRTINFASSAGDGRAFRVAQPRCRFDKRIEHGLQVEGRAADHLEHVGGGGLLLQRLGAAR